MRNDLVKAHGNEAGFGVWGALLLLVIIGLIVAVIMKVLTLWVALGLFVLAVIVLGVLANMSDISRYLKISSM